MRYCELKRCPHCHVVKHRSLYHRDKSRWDGVTGWCRDCRHESAREYRVTWDARRLKRARDRRYRERLKVAA